MTNLSSATSHRPKRRFTIEERLAIRDDYLRYVPIRETAVRLGRSEGVVGQEIHRQKLRRSGLVSHAMRWAPGHLLADVGKVSDNVFIQRCYDWREDMLAGVQAQSDADKARAAEEMAVAAAAIDQRADLDRVEKMIAKRMLGMTLESIGDQHGLTRERVRQLTSPEYIAAKTDPVDRIAKLDAKIDKLQAKREAILKKNLRRLVAAWDCSSEEIRDEFLRCVGAVRLNGSTSAP